MTKSSFMQAHEFGKLWCSCFQLILEVSITASLASSINWSFQLHDVFNLDNDNRGEDTPTLIGPNVRLLHGKYNCSSYLSQRS
ncbi:K(+) efflux antiporter 6-like [Pyrus ussuriensis x Pyrus communis]|uniref:K(+) efflux antiporter 6-like n=1 Tax=Pyrus ussuriensis x Pyrus communis TaxID=2448454 RepID=A0A5N5ID31_9ROSA|nr:K(+) efflux antiporter 6-like [Pyrus ussuriensis x Pyrus communis]